MNAFKTKDDKTEPTYTEEKQDKDETISYEKKESKINPTTFNTKSQLSLISTFPVFLKMIKKVPHTESEQ